MPDLVLVGGGHAHVHVLTSFGRQPLAGVRVILVGREALTPYSGMIPGFVAGRYSFEDCHIDLPRLAARTGARFVEGEVVGVDRTSRQVLLGDGTSLSYDFLSLDVGAAPSLDALPGARQHAIAVKPIAELGQRWLAFLERIEGWRGRLAIVVVGGGAGGVELALAIDHRLRREAPAARVHVTLATREEILAGHAASAQRRMRAIFARRGLGLNENDAVVRLEAGAAVLASGKRLAADAIFVVTEAAADGWLARTGLALDARGFVALEPSLRSTNDPSVFAAGDCAGVAAYPRPKSGVFAVRQGPPLADNLRRVLAGRAPQPFVPQTRYLSIIGTGDGRALASRGGWAVEGAWVWRWKDFIDRRWTGRYR
jgi:selenide,water dikinase